MPIPGSVPVTGFIAPTDEGDEYAVTDAKYGRDGHRSVADAAERDAITEDRRRHGMTVFTQDDGKKWMLNAGPWAGDDTDWTEETGGGASVINLSTSTYDIQKELPASGGYWSAIAFDWYSLLVIIADGSDNSAWSSDGGYTWTAGGSLPSSGAWDNLAYNWNEGVYCAIKYGSTAAATTYDGVAWDAQTLAVATRGPIAADIEGGIGFVNLITDTGIAASRDTQTSVDGASWVQNVDALPSPAGGFWFSLGFGDDIFLAFTNTLYTSSADGVTWAASASLPVSGNWGAPVWNGTTWLAISGGTTAAITSPDGTTWTQRTLPDPSPDLWGRNTAWDGQQWCIVSTGGTKVAFSPDGDTWEMHALSSPALDLGDGTDPPISQAPITFFVPSTGDDAGLVISSRGFILSGSDLIHSGRAMFGDGNELGYIHGDAPFQISKWFREPTPYGPEGETAADFTNLFSALIVDPAVTPPGGSTFAGADFRTIVPSTNASDFNLTGLRLQASALGTGNASVLGLQVSADNEGDGSCFGLSANASGDTDEGAVGVQSTALGWGTYVGSIGVVAFRASSTNYGGDLLAPNYLMGHYITRNAVGPNQVDYAMGIRINDLVSTDLGGLPTITNNVAIWIDSQQNAQSTNNYAFKTGTGRHAFGFPIETPTYTVVTLPTPVQGMRALVSDATVTTFASIVVGSGSNKVPVYYDGSNWRIG